MSEPTARVETSRSGIGLLTVAAFATITLGALKVFGLVEIGWLIVFMPLLVALGVSILGAILIVAAISLVGVVAALVGRK